MGGEDKDRNATTEVLQLDCPGDQISSCQWEQVGNLQIARSWHVSIALPESYDICKTTSAGTTKIQHDLKMILIMLSIMLLISFSA